MLSLLEMENCVCNKIGETADVDACKLFVQMRMRSVQMAERSNASIVVWIWVPYVCVGGIGRVIWRLLAEQLWEHAVEELMTGLAGQNPRWPQLLVNMPAEKTEFRKRSALIWLSCSSTHQQVHSYTYTHTHTHLEKNNYTGHSWQHSVFCQTDVSTKLFWDFAATRWWRHL